MGASSTDLASQLLEAIVKEVVANLREEPASVGYVSKARLAEDLGISERTRRPKRLELADRLLRDEGVRSSSQRVGFSVHAGFRPPERVLRAYFKDLGQGSRLSRH